MENILLKAEKRTVLGKQVRALRRAGYLPAVLYGRHIPDPLPLLLNLREATRVLSKATPSTLITLDVEGTEYPALVREKQRDFIKNTLLHVDFLAISLTEKITAYVPVEWVGESPAVKDYNAVLVAGLQEIEVECLPSDLPEKIVVDLSSLARPGDGIYVRDLALGSNVEILSDSDEMIVVATAAGGEEVEAAAAEVGPEEPEVIEKGKKKEEEEEGE